MERKKKKVVISTVVLIVLLALTCYLGVVSYFFVFDSNNTFGKLKCFGGFLSDESIGNMYLNSSFEIEVEGVQNRAYGVNVNEDGFVLSVLTELGDYQDKEILLRGNNGAMYKGKVVFADEYNNLAILKVIGLGDKANVKLPYVEIGSLDDVYFFTSLISVGLPTAKENVNKTRVIGLDKIYSDCHYVTVDGQQIVNRVYENVFYFSCDSTNSTGGVFNRYGQLVGLKLDLNNASDEELDDEDEEILSGCSGITVEIIGSILQKVIDKNGVYKNELIENFNAFDMEQLSVDVVSNKVGGLYYNGVEVPSEIIDICSLASGVYLLDDFNYNNQTLEKGHLIKYISVAGKTILIDNVYQVIDIFYSLESGDRFSIVSCLVSEYDIENAQMNTITTPFVVA